MFHAVVRSAHDALHFIAEIDGYNLETLQQHVREAVKESGSAELYVEVDSPEQAGWELKTRRWLSKLSRTGVQVRVETVPSNAASTRRPARSVVSPRRTTSQAA
jgi:hypothetical protein